jgi:hypothetical protein
VATSTPSTSGRRPTHMTGSVMGSHLRRPIGTKRAKAAVAAGSQGGSNNGVEEPVVDLCGPTLSSTAAEEMSANFSKMNSNNKNKDAFDMKAKEFDMKAKVFDMFMPLGKKDVAEQVANTLLQYCNNSSTTCVVPPGEVQEVEEEVAAEEEEEEDTGSPDLGWAHNEEKDQEEGHGKNGDTESVGSETVLQEPPPHQATFLSSGFGTQALMEETQSRFTENGEYATRGAPPINVTEAEAEWRWPVPEANHSNGGGGWHDGGSCYSSGRQYKE